MIARRRDTAVACGVALLGVALAAAFSSSDYRPRSLLLGALATLLGIVAAVALTARKGRVGALAPRLPPR
jgi:membrane associated rhomboid family serine protease